MVICKGHGMPERLPQSKDSHGAVGRNSMTVCRWWADRGDRWDPGRPDTGLSGEKHRLPLNPQSHSLHPLHQPQSHLPEHSSDPGPPHSHLTERSLKPSPWHSRLAGLGTPSIWASFPNASFISSSHCQTPGCSLECAPHYCLGDPNSISSVRSSLSSLLPMRREKQSLLSSHNPVYFPSLLRDSLAGYEVISSHFPAGY